MISVNRNVVLRMAAVVGALALSFAGGYWTNDAIRETQQTEQRVRLEGYKYINPLLECESTREGMWYREVRPQRDAIQRVIESNILSGEASRVSIYYRDLRNGPWIGINENDHFTPASLMKVPLMMTILKKAERDPSILQRRIKYPGGEDTTQKQLIKPKEPMQPGMSYTVEDLLFRMIAYSDNNASTLLAGTEGPAEVAKLMEQLHIPYDVRKDENNITVRDYTSFFRILFNASYLNHDMSERALGLLAFNDFDRGIRAGLPPQVVLASKFGEYATRRPGGIEYELQELGIVYYPGHPYLLGIVTRGPSFERLPGVLQKVSAAVYREVDRQFRSAAAGER